MDKLVELLKNKDGYDNITYSKQSDGGYMFWLDDIAYREERIISKKFGFIKWLIDNDKIDKEKIMKAETLPLIDVNTNYMLMALAIQDEPIRFLISILK